MNYHSLQQMKHFMRLALTQAKQAEAIGEVPVGALIVLDDAVISSAYNLRERDQNAVAHAELLAIERACSKTGSWRLSGCTLYVTLEPCPMCAGAIINARIAQVVFAAFDQKAGCCGSLLNLFDQPFNHNPRYLGGLYANESATLLQSFFNTRRK